MKRANYVGFILTGGLGVRMKEITSSANRHRIPKVLVPVGARRAVDFAMETLRNAGIGKVRCHVVHSADQIKQHFIRMGYADEGLSWYPDEYTSGSFGAVLKMFRDDVSLSNSTVALIYPDIIHNMGLDPLIKLHEGSGADVTMTVNPVFDVRLLEEYGTALLRGMRNRSSFHSIMRYMEYIREFVCKYHSQALPVLDFLEKKPWPEALSFINDSSIYLLSPRVLRDFRRKEEMLDMNFHLIPWLLSHPRKYRFLAYIMDPSKYWADVGSLQKLYAANMDALALNFGPPAGQERSWERTGGNLVHRSARLDRNALAMNSIIGPGVRLGQNVFVDRSVLLDGCRVGADATVRNTIVFPEHPFMEGAPSVGSGIELVKCLFLGGELDGEKEGRSVFDNSVIYTRQPEDQIRIVRERIWLH